MLSEGIASVKCNSSVYTCCNYNTNFFDISSYESSSGGGK